MCHRRRLLSIYFQIIGLNNKGFKGCCHGRNLVKFIQYLWRKYVVKILYYDCFSGISGDMNLGAMIDLGVPQGLLVGELKKLKINAYEIAVYRDRRRGIEGIKVDVSVPSRSAGHGHHDAERRAFKDTCRTH